MINVTKAYLPNIDKYKSYIDEIYTNGQLTNNGPLAQKLERRLQKYLGVNNVFLWQMELLHSMWRIER